MDDVNPYASPAIPDALLPAPARVGVWRDGDRIVLHPAATLPRYCIATGRPAQFGYFIDIVAARRFRLGILRISLCVPLSAPVHYACRRRRWAAAGCAAVPAVVTLLAFLVGEHLDWTPEGWSPVPLLCILTGVVGVICLYFYLQYSQLLYCVDHLGEYWVLRGADERFLRRLPEWSEALTP